MNVQSAVLAHLSDAAVYPRSTGPELGLKIAVEQEIVGVDTIVSAALLVAGAFRMRDEQGLIATLRLLTNAVAIFEAEQPEPANDD